VRTATIARIRIVFLPRVTASLCASLSAFFMNFLRA
jgi:hypothetical protein